MIGRTPNNTPSDKDVNDDDDDDDDSAVPSI